MTIRETLETMLVNHGLFPEQAKTVIDQMIIEYNEAMEGRWDDEVSSHPNKLLEILWAAAKREAIQWIDKNMPKHFARKLLI